jgi:hypothetical protein
VRPEAGGSRLDASGVVVLLALAAPLAAIGCLVDSRCVGDSDCEGNEQCGGDGKCFLECVEGVPSGCLAERPICIVAENRCVECVAPGDCGESEQCVTGACVPEAAPDFTLVDLNSHSPSFEQPLALSDFRGEVVLIFFATLG